MILLTFLKIETKPLDDNDACSSTEIFGFQIKIKEQ
jgi:hypothetical protein